MAGRKIRKAAVLGAGTMGAAIAAHLANVGIPSYLLDIVPKELTEEEKTAGLTLEDRKVRNRLAQQSIENLKKMRPAPFYDSDDAKLITPGNLEDDLPKLSEVDWIIEAVVENLDIKKRVFANIEENWKEGTIVSTNTSGISVNRMVEDCSENFRRYFLGTHFFNPPRYMKLLEIIPCKDSDPEVLRFMEHFCEITLGKGVVYGKDTPNFIANRIGVYGMAVTTRLMAEEELSVEEVDAITGPAMGRPKSASFRTMDMVGLDVFLHVAKNVQDRGEEEWEKKAFDVPAFVQDMFEQKMLGEKTKAGFYKAEKGPEGKEILALDYTTMEYRPRQKTKFPSLDATRDAATVGERINVLLQGKDKAADFAWKCLKPLLTYSAVKAEEIADDIVAIDRAMRWGFNWDLGPFEIWDAIGVKEATERLESDGESVPPLVQEMLDKGFISFYKKENGRTHYYDFKVGEYAELQPRPGVIILSDLKKEENRVVKSTSGASLVDIGDGVLCLEIHSPRQAIGPDVYAMISRSAEEVEKGYEGLVIASQERNFSVGANLMMVLMEAQAEEWDELDLVVQQFQRSLMRLKYCERPVVVAPHGMTLGGGYEICAHGHRIRPAAETYMGLVEVGVGVIPAGGGCKEMVLRSVENVQDNPNIDLLPFVQKAFETVAMARVATSAKEAFKHGYMRPAADSITINGDRHIYEAKNVVLAMAREGFAPPKPGKIRVIGEPGLAALKMGIYFMKEGNYISEYDAYLGEQLAYIFSGGPLPPNTWVEEQHLLNLEREVFVRLCSQRKTQERMVHMLQTGKPLRN